MGSSANEVIGYWLDIYTMVYCLNHQPDRGAQSFTANDVEEGDPTHCRVCGVNVLPGRDDRRTLV